MISFSELKILFFIKKRGKTTFSEICQTNNNYTIGQVIRIVRKYKRMGYIASEKEGRKRNIYLTEAGKAGIRDFFNELDRFKKSSLQ